MDRKVVGVVFFGVIAMVAVVTSPQLLDVSIYVSIYLSIYLSASLKTKLFCETVSVFEHDNIKNDASLRPDLLTSLTNMSLVLRLPRGIHLCRSYSYVPRVPSFLDILQNPHVCRVQNPLRLPHNDASTFNIQKWDDHVAFVAFWLRSVLRATTACTFSTSELPKVLRTLTLLTSKCASRHNGVHFGVHFFDMSIVKSAPKLMRFFVHFDFEMCFAPQRHAIFHFSCGQMAPHPPL